MKILKTLTKALLVISMVLCFNLTALAYTFDGEIDPSAFPSWEVISSVQLSPYEATVVVKSPDTEAKILRVIVKVEYGGIRGYGYTVDGYTTHGKTYVYIFNTETVNYDEFVE